MLSKPETARLAELEALIEENMQQFYNVGQALTEILESRLYRSEHGNFEDYCVERWGFRRNYAYRLIEAAKVIGDLSPIGIQQLPSSERQVRALAKVPEGERAGVWTDAVDAAGGKQPSGRQIEEAYQPADTPPPAPNIRITPKGLEFIGEITDASLLEGMRALKSTKDTFHCALADLMKVGTEKLGQGVVEHALEELEYDHDDAMRATALNSLPPAARDLGLSASHYVAVTRSKDLTTDAARMEWLRKAKRHGLTPLQLRRSILAGKVVTSEDVQLASGRGSGINTLENWMFLMGQWAKHIAKVDPISGWPPEKAQMALEKFGPLFPVIDAMMARAKGKPVTEQSTDQSPAPAS